MLTDIKQFVYNDPMAPYLWDMTTHFKFDENWGDPYKMWVHLIYNLDAFRDYIHPHKLIVHCGWELRDSGWHPSGAAADLHCPTMWYKALAYKAMQFPFTGIGLYPYWNSPGVHLDMRPLRMDARRKVWWRDENKKYHDVHTLQDLGLVPNSTEFSNLVS